MWLLGEFENSLASMEAVSNCYLTKRWKKWKVRCKIKKECVWTERTDTAAI